MENLRNKMIWVLAIAGSLAAPGTWAEEDEDVAELETFVAEEAVEDEPASEDDVDEDDTDAERSWKR